MKTTIIGLFLLTTSFLHAQNTATWIGGAPGKETKWSEPKNWSDQRVPDEFSYVVISGRQSGHDAQPVITDLVEVASIELRSGASLVISSTGEVAIDGTDIYTEGIANYGGRLVNHGVINLMNIDGLTADRFAEAVEGEGIVFLNGRSYHAEELAELNLSNQ